MIERHEESYQPISGLDNSVDPPVKRPLVVGPSGELLAGDGALAFRKDDTGTYLYLGEAVPGTATSAAGWRISRVTNADSTIVWADGDGSFDNIWDNRASLSYS